MTDPRLAPFIAPASASHARFYPRGPYVSITLAQFIIESDWGEIVSGRKNYFGIKARLHNSIPTEPATERWTHETLHGIYQKVPQYFADYPSIEACFDAHAYLLCSPHYQRCVEATSPAAYAHALWLCNYATGIPGHPYDQALVQIMDQNNLYQYDPKG
jgi:flagellum-specific peptidoglycan hydrolase FlgJ